MFERLLSVYSCLSFSCFYPSFTSSLLHSTCTLPSTSSPMSTPPRDKTTALTQNEEYCTLAIYNLLTVNGWRLLQEKAPYQRDYLLPSPSKNYPGVRCRELRYDTAFAVRGRLLASLSSRGSQLFNFKFRHSWSPHSGRNFRPTAASVLNVPTQEKNFLGGWSAEGSERYHRLAKFKVA